MQDDSRDARPLLDELGELAEPVNRRIAALVSTRFVQRFWHQDPSLWADTPDGTREVSRRLGWLDSPQKALTLLPSYVHFADEVRSAGITRFLVLGMGGSSLATEVLGSVFEYGVPVSERRLGILDSTDPDQVALTASAFPTDSSLYIVSSKSGGTAEVMAAFEHFWKLTGGDGSRFIAISDGGTSLQELAAKKGFRRAFIADASVGGRYSALTDFGMIPAALLGTDLDRLLAEAIKMQRQCGVDAAPWSNPGFVLGALLGEATLRGRDKLTIVADPEIDHLPNWIEQLVAESSGKQGKGIVPVALEPLDAPPAYGSDRCFIYLRRDGRLDRQVRALRGAGFPVMVLDVPDAYSVAAEFVRWEIAVATACHIIGVNAFDQPDVQESKDRTKAKIDMLQRRQHLDEGQWDLDLSGTPDLDQVDARLRSFLQEGLPGDYVAINAYLPMRPDVESQLQQLRVHIRARTKLATTVGFGPSFQHSTGQLHKGGPNSGLFIQIVCEPAADLPVPGASLSFGALIRAQALGDYETLVTRGRRVLRVHLGRAEDVELLRRSLDEQSA